MARVTIKQLDAALDVELWGHKYDPAPATRAILRASEALQIEHQDLVGKDLTEMNADELDDLVAFWAAQLDLQFRPRGNGRTKPGTMLRRKWESDEVELAQIVQLMADLMAAGTEEQDAPPT